MPAMNSIDPSGTIYCHLIEARNELQFLSLPALSLVNSVSLDPEISIVKAVWSSQTSKPKRRHDDEQTNSTGAYAISCLTSSNQIITVGAAGVVDTLSVKQNLNDITFFNKSLWGCFDGGIVEIKGSQKPIKHKEDFQFIASAATLLVGSDTLFTYNKKFTQLHEMEPQNVSQGIVYNDEGFFDVEANQWVDSVGILGIYKGDDLLVLKQDRIEVLDSAYAVIHTISTNVRPSSVWTDKDALFVIYIVENRPRVEKIDNFRETSSIQVDVQSHQPEIAMLDTNNEALDNILESAVVNNMSLVESYKQLNKALNNNDVKSIVEICSTTNDESNISNALDHLTESQTDALFKVLCHEVQTHILQSTNVSIWLKFILLKNKVTITKDKKIAGLEKQLNGSIKLMPNLLAIRGRLQLLKSQQQLRNSPQTIEDADTTVNDSEAEESVYIANGENDEDDIQDVDDDEEQ